MPIRDIGLALLVVAVWGFNFTVIKLSVEAFPPLFSAALRFFIAAVPLVFFIRPPAIDWRLLVGFGLSFGVALYGFLNISMAFGMPAGLSSLVLQTQAFFTMALAFLLLGERPNRFQLIGAAVAFVGIAVIASTRLEGAGLWPFLLCILAAIAWGLSNILTKKAGKFDPVAFTVWGALVAPLPLLALSLRFEGPADILTALRHFDWTDVVMFAYLAFPATLMGGAIWSGLLARHPTALVAPFSLLVPVVGLLSGSLVLGETITPTEVGGAALVIAGLVVTLMRTRTQS